MNPSILGPENHIVINQIIIFELNRKMHICFHRIFDIHRIIAPNRNAISKRKCKHNRNKAAIKFYLVFSTNWLQRFPKITSEKRAQPHHLTDKSQHFLFSTTLSSKNIFHWIAFNCGFCEQMPCFLAAYQRRLILNIIIAFIFSWMHEYWCFCIYLKCLIASRFSLLTANEW